MLVVVKKVRESLQDTNSVFFDLWIAQIFYSTTYFLCLTMNMRILIQQPGFPNESGSDGMVCFSKLRFWWIFPTFQQACHGQTRPSRIFQQPPTVEGWEKNTHPLIGWVIPFSKWLGSPTILSHEVRPFGRGPITPGLGDLNSHHGYFQHVSVRPGMILQVIGLVGGLLRPTYIL